MLPRGPMKVGAEVQKSMLAALDSVETKLGRPMMQSGDEEGQKLYSAALDGVRKELGLDKVNEKDLMANEDYAVVPPPPPPFPTPSGCP